MVDEGEPGVESGLWMVHVTLDGMAGLTVVEIEDDGSVQVLGPEGGVYLFPTRRGMADFLASGEAHSLLGRLDGFDTVGTEPEVEADFVFLRDKANLAEHVAAALWMNCLLLVDGCGIEAPETVEDAATQVAALTAVRDDFEQPGYAEADYWIGRYVQPVRVTLPAGSGVTLVAPMGFWDTEPEAQAFLGDFCEVLLFHSAGELLRHVRAEGTDEMRQASWWPADAPDCEPRRSVDVGLADPHDPDSDAFEYLRGLAMVLTDRMNVFNVREQGEHRLHKAAERIAEVLGEVNGKVTWR